MHNREKLLIILLFQGYSRKGAALAYLKRYEDALNAYKEGLQLDPNNAQLKDGVREVQAQMAQGKMLYSVLCTKKSIHKI